MHLLEWGSRYFLTPSQSLSDCTQALPLKVKPEGSALILLYRLPVPPWGRLSYLALTMYRINPVTPVCSGLCRMTHQSRSLVLNSSEKGKKRPINGLGLNSRALLNPCHTRSNELTHCGVFKLTENCISYSRANYFFQASTISLKWSMALVIV